MPTLYYYNNYTSQWEPAIVGAEGATGPIGPSGFVWVTAPVANNSSGTAGQTAYDSGGNFYICVATDTWAKFTGTTSW